MRTRWGWALSVLGLIVAVAGAGLMVVLGPDSRFTTGPHAIETDAAVAVTSPEVVRWAGVTVDIRAELPARKPVFVGIGNSVDVQDYVAKTRRLEVTSFDRPWKISTRTVDGTPNLPGAPTAVDWWIAQSVPRLGGASVSAELPDETVSVAIVSLGSSNLTGLQVTLAYGVRGGFQKGLSAVLLGLALVWVGVLVRRGLWAADDEDDESDGDDGTGEDVDDGTTEEVVYVYVDDDGVEHEISAEEAAGMQVVEEVVEVDAEPTAGTASGSEPMAGEPSVPSEPSVPTVPQVTVPGILTAADIAAGVDEPEKEKEPDPEQVVYVYVDEDGVEHEVSEAELAEFEVVDDEDDDSDTTDGKGRS